MTGKNNLSNNTESKHCDVNSGSGIIIFIINREMCILYTKSVFNLCKEVTFGTKKKWPYKTGDLLKKGSIHMKFSMTG